MNSGTTAPPSILLPLFACRLDCIYSDGRPTQLQLCSARHVIPASIAITGIRSGQIDVDAKQQQRYRVLPICLNRKWHVGVQPLTRASARNASRNNKLGRPFCSILGSVKITASHARTAPCDRHALHTTIFGTSTHSSHPNNDVVFVCHQRICIISILKC